jgi:regulator of cell morphogenesis and NO signaling
MEKLDVTVIEPRFKHPTIFEHFDALSGGQAFIIHNDHDPKPLYYQMIAERGQIFNWEYLLEGPDFWEVKITKLNDGEKSETIGEMVASDYRKAEVFRKYGLDFCCGGKKTLEKACEKKGLDVVEVKKALKAVEDDFTTNTEDHNSWELDFLADYIINKHHKYIENSHPMLFEFSQKVARVHGSRHAEVVDIAHYYNEVAEELQLHMHKEEMILFPYIKELAIAKRNGTPMERPQFGSIQNPINMMEAEHESAGGNMEKIRELSNNFTPPEDACNSYRVLFAKLKEYEADLHHHIHLENNILFKKAIELEKELFNS